MKVYLKLKTLSPLAITSNRASSTTETLNYIPGTSLRGSIARYYMEKNKIENPMEDKGFKDLFFSDCIYFPDLYPTDSNVSYWLPSTAISCKRYKGFSCKGEKGPHEERHGVKDILFEQVILNKLAGDKNKDLPEEGRCPVCDEALSEFREFYEKIDMEKSENSLEDKYRKVKLNKRLITRTGIDRATLTVEKGILYSLQVIGEEQYFSGYVEVKNEDMEEIIKELILEGAILSFGVSKTRGLGRTEVKEWREEEEKLMPLDERLKYFNEKFLSDGKTYGFSEEKSYFSIDLQSDVILMDRFLRYKTCIDKDFLSEISSLESEKLELLYSNSSFRVISGWNMTLGLPKEDEIAIEKGSVFFFEYNSSINEIEEELLSIEKNRLGLRTEEGFGKIRICNPFHWEVLEFEICDRCKAIKGNF